MPPKRSTRKKVVGIPVKTTKKVVEETLELTVEDNVGSNTESSLDPSNKDTKR